MDYNLRLAGPEDIGVLYSMSIDFVKASGYTFPVDKTKVEQLISDIIYSGTEQKICLVLTNIFDVPVGMLAAIIDEPFFSRTKVAQELVWWVDPAHRGSRKSLELVNAYEYWAMTRGAIICQMASIADLEGEKVGKMLERLGYSRKELSYCKEL
jgi:hypothetical protein